MQTSPANKRHTSAKAKRDVNKAFSNNQNTKYCQRNDPPEQDLFTTRTLLKINSTSDLFKIEDIHEIQKF